MKRRSKSSTRTNFDPSQQRINKVLATAGLGSRRDVEELILQGRVEVDGKTVTNLATRVNPQECKIEVDGQLLKQPKLVYYALNKPKGVLSTSSDPSGRMRVIDFVPDRHRVFSVGRLDQHSEGLMLLTNDGDLAQRLAHPRFRVQKTYFVVVAGILTNDELAKLRKGVYLAEGIARIDGARIRKTRKTCTELEILLSEGKNREIRRILARAGHKVVLLRRLAIGTLRLAELPVGAARELTAAEVKALYTATETKTSTPKAKSQETNSTSAAVSSVAPEKIVTPIESDGFDDFGMGLEGDYAYDETQLTLSDDVVEFGATAEDELDEDFVADFDSINSGSVLEYEEESEEPPTPRQRSGRSSQDGEDGSRGERNRGGGGNWRSGGEQRGQSRNRSSFHRSSGERDSQQRGSRSGGMERRGSSWRGSDRSDQVRSSSGRGSDRRGSDGRKSERGDSSGQYRKFDRNSGERANFDRDRWNNEDRRGQSGRRDESGESRARRPSSRSRFGDSRDGDHRSAGGQFGRRSSGSFGRDSENRPRGDRRRSDGRGRFEGNESDRSSGFDRASQSDGPNRSERSNRPARGGGFKRGGRFGGDGSRGGFSGGRDRGFRPRSADRDQEFPRDEFESKPESSDNRTGRRSGFGRSAERGGRGSDFGSRSPGKRRFGGGSKGGGFSKRPGSSFEGRSSQRRDKRRPGSSDSQGD